MKQIIPFLFAFFLYSCTLEAQSSVNVQQFEKGLQENKDAQLLDVRTAQEFNSGHLSGALWADWKDATEFKRRIKALDKTKPVYVYCLSGGRSAAAAEALKKEGFENIVEMEGGINAWKQAGNEVIGKQNVAQISEDTYKGYLASSSVVLVDFGAEWCPPCKKMNPIISEIEQNYQGKMTLINIDGGSQDQLMKSKNIQQMPTFILYKDGKEKWRASGIVAKEDIENAIKSLL